MLGRAAIGVGHGVGPAGAVERVVLRVAGQRVVAATAGQVLDARVGVDLACARLAARPRRQGRHDVVARDAIAIGHGVDAARAVEHVVRGAAGEHVVAGAAGEVVDARVRVDLEAARLAAGPRRKRCRDPLQRAAIAVADGVRAAAAVEHVAVAVARQRVVPAAADEVLDARVRVELRRAGLAARPGRERRHDVLAADAIGVGHGVVAVRTVQRVVRLGARQRVVSAAAGQVLDAYVGVVLGRGRLAARAGRQRCHDVLPEHAVGVGRRIAAARAVEQVARGVAGEHVVAAAARQALDHHVRVVLERARLAAEPRRERCRDTLAGAPVDVRDDVHAPTAVEDVVPAVAGERVHAAAARQVLDARVRVGLGGARLATGPQRERGHDIRARGTVGVGHPVDAVEALQRVVAGAADQHVVAVAAAQGVGAGAAVDHHGLGTGGREVVLAAEQVDLDGSCHVAAVGHRAGIAVTGDGQRRHGRARGRVEAWDDRDVVGPSDRDRRGRRAVERDQRVGRASERRRSLAHRREAQRHQHHAGRGPCNPSHAAHPPTSKRGSAALSPSSFAGGSPASKRGSARGAAGFA